jgi:hypothetical protein
MIPTLPGWQHLRTSYVVRRTIAGRLMAITVPTERMTPAELRAKGAELRGLGEHAWPHADEISKYLVQRFGR